MKILEKLGIQTDPSIDTKYALIAWALLPIGLGVLGWVALPIFH